MASASYTLGANIENLVLTGTGDTKATGNDLANVLTGNDGNNILNGAAGADTLQGGGGDDTYVVDNAGDVVIENGHAGTDTVKASISYTLGANIENLVLTRSDDIDGIGNAADNKLTGNSGDNTLAGAKGNDTLNGGGGADTLVGGSGKDVLSGGGGKDVLTGSAGIDTLHGGTGADTFVFATGDTAAKEGKADVISDFKARQGDQIDLHLIDAKEAKNGDQAFHFIGTAAFSGTAGELRYEKTAHDTFIYGDTDGDHKADFAIHLEGATKLDADIFIL
jgi:Ca2+-binding RTX toxin-like protein